MMEEGNGARRTAPDDDGGSRGLQLINYSSRSIARGGLLGYVQQ